MVDPESCADLPRWFNRTAHALNGLCLGTVLGAVLRYLVQGTFDAIAVAIIAVSIAGGYVLSWLVYLVGTPRQRPIGSTPRSRLRPHLDWDDASDARHGSSAAVVRWGAMRPAANGAPAAQERSGIPGGGPPGGAAPTPAIERAEAHHPRGRRAAGDHVPIVGPQLGQDRAPHRQARGGAARVTGVGSSAEDASWPPTAAAPPTAPSHAARARTRDNNQR